MKGCVVFLRRLVGLVLGTEVWLVQLYCAMPWKSSVTFIRGVAPLFFVYSIREEAPISLQSLTGGW